ncbi:NusA-like transcription termination signal-binding factor [Methanoculleus sp.]|uniref:NusA-like transcription termination signal-binding factor n=1 Tax=Methanoculleus sp. TaxID=90427 RepID=UPI0025E1D2AC|nr:NusA-like transcription termination signal-binding factor [Methanoculleus sp.]MCK9319104.1 NusA-like transcription termination signal-binding factor [Methanoculleus sp.]MDD2254935.1 NusA-like transcription termination signal-binding factor [Methanoculleus sp.]MDD2788352.1 NusA-like transcription termination signal-binding factor [Methanoculleus sp.]MDD3217239.1 NusA-like transcription termination signal-binding factor [Methanoculleus sp.]MDD4315203.1 NusA-like transcription termination sign
MIRTICFKERRYIEELRILTRATALDCIIDERFDRVIYLIKEGDMGLAIGRKGGNIRKMQRVLGKRIEMVEYSPEIENFAKNVFKPAEVVGVRREDDGRLTVQIKKGDLGIAIGKGGCTIEKARLLLSRYFDTELGEVLAGGDDHA